MRLVVGITGASGSIYGVCLLKSLHQLGIETHLIISKMGERVVEHECGLKLEDLKVYCHSIHDIDDMFAPVASGSYKTQGMIIIPCSMKTLGAISNGYSDNLIARSADVTLKEGRKLVIVPRETPLSQIHLENLLKLSRMGAKVLPASPGFYHHPQSIADLVAIMVGKTLDMFDIDHNLYQRWGEDRAK
jgi:flavin prenyltransferase